MLGLEMMLQSMFRSMGVQPEDILKTIVEFARLAKSIDDRLARIEAKLDAMQDMQPPAGKIIEVAYDEGTANGNEYQKGA